MNWIKWMRPVNIDIFIKTTCRQEIETYLYITNNMLWINELTTINIESKKRRLILCVVSNADFTLRNRLHWSATLPCDHGIADVANQNMFGRRAAITSMIDCATRNRSHWSATLPWRSRRSGILPLRSHGSTPIRRRDAVATFCAGAGPSRCKSARICCKMAFIPYIM